MESFVSDEVQRLLVDQTIGKDGPGTILDDFASLLGFIGKDGIRTSGKYQFLPHAKLDLLNAQMTYPVEHRLTRAQQRSFPHLHGLYLILRASGLGISLDDQLMIDPEMLTLWHDLKPTEQYFTLLESWLVEGSCAIIAESGDDCFDTASWVFQKLLSSRRKSLDIKGQQGLLYGTMHLVSVALMELFGWVRLEFVQPQDGEGPKIEKIERLPFGDAMIDVLNAHYLTYRFAVPDEETRQEIGVLQKLFRPYFPEWQRTLTPPEWEFRNGTYVWHVSVEKAWRRIKAPAELSLEQLAKVILQAFGFDNQHLYYFELRDARSRQLEIVSPQDAEADVSTDEVTLGDLPLAKGQTMTFVYDYADHWEFTVKLEEVTESEPKLNEPQVSAEEGRAPEQYASYDEDEDE